jgi:hypothetical protein
MEQHNRESDFFGEDDCFTPPQLDPPTRQRPSNTRWGVIEPKLKGDKSNLIEWFVAMQMSLKLDKLYDPIFKGTCTTEEDFRAWNIVYTSLASNLRAEVQFDFEWPNCTMKTLNTMYGTTDNFIATSSFNRKIARLFLHNYKTPMELYDAAIALNNQANWLRLQGMDIHSESSITKSFILGLGDDWADVFSTYWEIQECKNAPFELSKVKTLLVRKLEKLEAMKQDAPARQAAFNTT